ncbi:MAG TPA: neocarzinostatin apoprotein domain-containing protein [Acidimicrobiales bacterium]|nr:neocarzinostatin apoprotein domain-containing protein [Acidimicrobiales bacterium]
MRHRLATGVAGLVAAAGLAACTTGPAVTVTPNTDLVDGQVVTAKGSGYTASSSLGMIQCVAGADSIDDCDGRTATSFSADADGRFQKAFTVRRVISHNVDQQTDCAARAGACVVASVYIHGFQGLATARLVFDG